jgi:uncharacterized protein HemX
MFKLVVSILIALVLGGGAGVYYSEQKHQELQKMELRSHIQTQVRNLNMLDERKLADLREMLIFLLDCDVVKLSGNIESGTWQQSLTDLKALQDAEAYYDPNNDCRSGLEKAVATNTPER